MDVVITNNGVSTINMVTFQDRFYGAIFGLAIGDALGAPVEFRERGTFPEVTDYLPCDTWNLSAGSWTDDTSMMLALIDSIISCRGIDPKDQLQRYADWYLCGNYSVNGKCFDIGTTTKRSIEYFIHTNNTYSPYDRSSYSGNGSLMRHLPVPLFTFQFKNPNLMHTSSNITSATTHSSDICLSSCYEFSHIIWQILLGLGKKVAFDGKIPNFDESEIQSSGYVKSTLELAKWCLLNTRSFQECVIKAVNYGGDADTLGAVAGALAGCYYGFPNIPDKFLTELAKSDEIMFYADNFYRFCSGFID